MGVIQVTEDFDDRQLHLDAEAEQYHPYEYQTENNTSWAGALPVKQYVFHRPASFTTAQLLTRCYSEDCMTLRSRKMLAVSASLGRTQRSLNPAAVR